MSFYGFYRFNRPTTATVAAKPHCGIFTGTGLCPPIVRHAVAGRVILDADWNEAG